MSRGQTRTADHVRSTDGCNRTRTALTSATSWSDLRQAAGLSLRAAELVTGINRGDLSKIEHGRLVPPPDQARRILEATS